ncbi:hypothetical protein MTR_4g071435 [Medicago truncatula]|uniref:Uncharacterized protein n=1 Tax=Medicago truncatula TaxID=3880 RepID=A0A072UL43_MEDTR|nr:hypothetical protein MTR_4g071435 [Medicago truncatula]
MNAGMAVDKLHLVVANHDNNLIQWSMKSGFGLNTSTKWINSATSPKVKLLHTIFAIQSLAPPYDCYACPITLD